ncbi:MAG: hypothetical protein WBG57_13035 [Ornithinimicrobium sp.]
MRPRATGLIVGIWVVQAAIAALWVGTSLLEDASFWVWPFGAAWASIAVLMAIRARRQWVEADESGISVQAGFRPRWTWQWQQIGDVTPEPAGPLVTHLAVVGRDGQVAETPLAKGDTRLREVWLARTREGEAPAAAQAN